MGLRVSGLGFGVLVFGAQGLRFEALCFGLGGSGYRSLGCWDEDLGDFGFGVRFLEFGISALG